MTLKTSSGKELIIRPYSMKSKSAKVLAEALGVRRLLTPVGNVAVINWGGGGYQGLNKPDAVSKAINKVSTFTYLKSAGVRTPDWTTNREEAKQWFREGATVMCRTKINGHSGEGIVIATLDNDETNIVDFPSAPLYTKYVIKDAEYRVHVFNGKVIDCRQKVPARDGRAVTSQHICTHTNGYVFGFATAPSDVAKQAIDAVKALGLDFGAVDVISKQSDHRIMMGMCEFTVPEGYVLEVNTAPGLTGTTITNYANAIKEYYGVS